MKFTANAESQFAKLPTFIKFCQTAEEAQLSKLHLVTTVWLPNKFPSVSLDTESFRLRISSEADFYFDLLDFLDSAPSEEKTLGIRVIDAKSRSYSFELLENETSSWSPLGEFGWKLEVNDRKTKKSRKVQNS